MPETSQSAAPAQTPSVSESQAPREEDRSPETPEEPQKKGLSLTSFAAIGAAVLAMALALAALSAIAKRFRVRRGFFLVLAVLLSLGALARIAWPAFETARDKPKGDPQETVINFLGALSRGDYAEAYARMDYVETLGLDYQPQRESQKQLFDAMRRTFSAELYGDCTVNGDRAYQQVSCRYLDVDKLNTEAKGQALIYISRYVSSHSVGDLYNESGNYRPELMWEAWDHAMLELLQHPDDYRSSAGVQLELRWHDGAWHVVPNDKLLQLLTGGIDVTEEGAA